MLLAIAATVAAEGGGDEEVLSAALWKVGVGLLTAGERVADNVEVSEHSSSPCEIAVGLIVAGGRVTVIASLSPLGVPVAVGVP